MVVLLDLNLNVIGSSTADQSGFATILYTCLTWIHVIITLIFSILIAAAPYWLNEPEQLVSDNYIQVAEQLNRNFRITSLFVTILTFGQLTFAGNLIAGVIKKLFKGRLRKTINLMK
jgi:hypothetical protein